MLQIKVIFRFNSFLPKLILNFLCFPAEEIENQCRFKIFNLNLILICNIYLKKALFQSERQLIHDILA